jgi:sugar-specific transcriptional regulator TrmB
MDYRELTYLGLSEKEAKVYLAALELGKSPVQKVAEKAGVNRATTYVIIEGLMKKGLMSTYTEGKKQFFCAESPEKLNLLFRDQELEIKKKQEYLEKLLPEIKSIATTTGKPTVRYFEGKEGMRAIAEELFYTNKDETVKMIYSYDLLLKMFSMEEIDSMRKRRQNKKVKAEIITNDQNYLLKTDADVVRLPSEKYNITSDIAIFGDKIRIVAQKGNQTGLIIENKEIANTLKIIFDLAWNGLKSFNKKNKGPKN